MFDLDNMFCRVADLDRIILRRRDREVGPKGERTFYLVTPSVRSAGETSGKPVPLDKDIDRLRVGDCKLDLHISRWIRSSG